MFVVPPPEIRFSTSAELNRKKKMGPVFGFLRNLRHLICLMLETAQPILKKKKVLGYNI